MIPINTRGEHIGRDRSQAESVWGIVSCEWCPERNRSKRTGDVEDKSSLYTDSGSTVHMEGTERDTHCA